MRIYAVAPPDSDLQVLKPEGKSPPRIAAGARDINLNSKILPLYLHTILPGITEPGDDGNYGSSAMLDVLALQVCRSLHPCLCFHNALKFEKVLVSVQAFVFQRFCSPGCASPIQARMYRTYSPEE